ncbi:MAG: TetR/AcrR family transcriptional regulator [Lachnospiraceae bacterium]|nr:TetR/AcrR family transcriptional regulator [Lachnospiraceae bacterium]
MTRANAREPLIIAAMDLFSVKGYDGTGVDEIAESIGIKGPTIYKYFRNKEDLLKAVIEQTEAEYIRGMEITKDLPERINSGAELKEYALKSLHFTVENDTALKMRRLITMEQFRNETLADLTTKHQLTYLQDVYTSIFKKMMKRGQMLKGDASIIALEFISPITLMIQLMDRNPGEKKKAIKIIEKHIDAFIERYDFI